jgi:hypothetical protein
MNYDIPNPYEGIQYNSMYGLGIKLETNPNAFLHHWVERELDEGLRWLADEFRLQALEIARADDDGMQYRELMGEGT